MTRSHSKYEYDIFNDSLDRRNIFDACKRATDFAVDNEVGNMVFIDRAARPMYIGVREYYKQHYPENEIPSMFFVNPNGFYRPIAKIFNPGLIKRKLSKQHPYLVSRKDEPTMVIDTCIHTGKSSLPVISGLIDVGFDNGFLAVVNGENNYSGAKPSKVLLDDRSHYMIGCYPFGDSSPVEKTKNDVVSKKYCEKDSKPMSAYNSVKRREIKQIINEYSDPEQETIPNVTLDSILFMALSSILLEDLHR